jgi:hypothetical protein
MDTGATRGNKAPQAGTPHKSPHSVLRLNSHSVCTPAHGAPIVSRAVHALKTQAIAKMLGKYVGLPGLGLGAEEGIHRTLFSDK